MKLPRLVRAVVGPALVGIAAAPILGPSAGYAAAREAEPGSDLRVLLIVIGPGNTTLSRFGHSMLWIQDGSAGITMAYNSGVSGTDQEGFWLDLMRGRLPTRSTARVPADVFLTQYVAENRSVWVQELNLLPSQRAKLKDLLDRDLRPVGRSGMYEFYGDNCTTAIRDALDWVLDGQIWEATSGVVSDRTLRWHTRRYTHRATILHHWVTLITGQPVDRPITRWEEMFLPVTLRDQLREIVVGNDAGEGVPLVSAEELWFEAAGPQPDESPPPSWPSTGAIGLALGFILAVLGTRSPTRRGAALGFDGIAGAWLLVTGGLGVVLAALWGLTDQAVTYRNENLLQFQPLSLVLLVPLIANALGVTRVRATVVVLAFLSAGLAFTGLALKLTPLFIQENTSVIALALPAHLGLALGMRGRAKTGLKALHQPSTQGVA